MKRLTAIFLASLAATSICGTLAIAGSSSFDASLFNAVNASYTVEFSRSKGTLKKITDGFTVSASTSQGSAMYLFAKTETDLSKDTMANYICDFSSNDAMMYVTTDSNAKNIQTFQKIESISMTTGSSNNRSFTIQTSTDGTNWSDETTMTFNNVESSYTFAKAVNYVRIVRGTSLTTSIKNFKVTYSCESGSAPTSSSSMSSSASTSVAGVYSGTDSYGTAVVLTLNEDKTGRYDYNGSYLTFTYSFSDPSLSLKFVAYGGNADEGDFSSVRLFHEEADNNTGVIENGILKITVYRMFGATLKTSTLSLTKE